MVFGFLAGLIGGSFAGIGLSGIEHAAQRLTLRLTPAKLLTEASYADAYRLDHLDETEYYTYMSELGYTKNQAKLWYNNSRIFLSKEDSSIRRIASTFETIMKHHDQVNAGAFDFTALDTIKDRYCSEMYKIGYDKQESSKVFEALRPIPTFSVLLEWLAKEAFEPEIITRFKLDEDIPQIWLDLMQGIGVPVEESKRYWYSHWTHPPLGQIANMYTRYRSDRNDTSESDALGAGSTVEKLSMSKDDYTEALKLHEIAPFWRDRIIANSFSPLPFSVLQQGYAYGLKPDAWFKGRLLDYGYSTDNAEFLLNVWRRKYPFGSRETINGNPILLYERGNRTKVEAKKTLTDNGVPDAVADYLLNKVDDKILLEKEKEAIKAWKRLYRANAMNESELRDAINNRINDEPRAIRLANIIVYGRDGAFVRLRISDIRRGFTQGNITKDQALDKLRDLRVFDEDIGFFFDLYKQDEVEDSDNENPTE